MSIGPYSRCEIDAPAIIATLATNADVRAGLVAAVHRESVGEWPLESLEGEASAWWVDAVLTALGGGE